MLEQVETALSEREVRDRYTQQGMLVYSIRQRGMLTGGGDISLGGKRVKLEQFVIFNQQFVTLVRAGLPIAHALELLIKRQRDPYFRSLLENVHGRVKSGELLSHAFEAQGVFPKIYTTTLLAGEKSGNLEEVLSRYIQFQRLTITFRKKLMASLVYPALLVVLVIVMLTFLVTYVVPQFADLYSQLKAELPAITQFMLALGVGAQKYFLVLVAGIAIALVLIWRWRRSDAGSRRLERIQMAIPILGEVWLKYQVATFARMMATLLSGGLPLVPALETAGGSLGSRVLANSLVAAAQRVREGQALSRALDETGAFPGMAVEMIEVGEGTGALPAMLTSVAEFYEEDVQTALTAAMALIEPAILVFMGGIVAFVLLSLYLPIFSLGSAGLAR